jgi:hypothetical protein
MPMTGNTKSNLKQNQSKQDDLALGCAAQIDLSQPIIAQSNGLLGG